MNLPDDLKNYRPSEDAFAVCDPDTAVLWIVALGVAALIFWPYLT